MEELAKSEYSKKTKSPKKSSCLTHFSDFCNQTSIHGLSFVGNTKLSYSERILFGLIFLVYLSISLYFVIDSYRKWAEHPIIIGINPEPTYIDDIPFPAVTICNVNQVRHSKVRDFPKDSAEYELLQTICEEDNKSENRSQPLNYKLHDYLSAVTHPCNETVIQCKFGGVRKDCNELFQATFTDDGMCCTFNAIHHSILYKSDSADSVNDNIKPWNPESGYPKNVELDPKMYPLRGPGTGVSMGLTIILNAQSEDYYCSNSNGVGFKVAVHSPNDIPRIKINVPVGAESRIRVAPDLTAATSAIRSINSKNRNCAFLSEMSLNSFTTYSKRNCEMECETNLTYASCDCIRFFQPNYNNEAQVCGTAQHECTKNVTIVSRQAGGTSCNVKCPTTCFDITYRQDIFTTPIRLGKYLINDAFLNNHTAEYIENNIAILNFFYENSEYYGYIQSEFTGMTDFFSSTGGLMGLFLGFSCVSLIEIIYFCTLRPICHKINKTIKD